MRDGCFILSSPNEEKLLIKDILLSFIKYSIVIILCFIFFQNTAFAANGLLITSNGVFDSTEKAFKYAFESNSANFVQVSLRLLIVLSIINFIWKMGTIIFRGNQLSDYVYEVVRAIFIVGLFLYFINSWKSLGAEGIQSIFNLMNKNSTAFLTNISPSNIVDLGFKSCEAIFANISFTDIFSSKGLFSIITAILIVICMCYAAVNFLIVKICLNFIIYIGVFLLAFFPLDFTRNVAVNFINLFLATLFKYFLIFLVASCCVTVFKGVLENYIELYQLEISVGNFPQLSLKATDWDNARKMVADLDKAQWIAILTLLCSAIMTYLLIDKLPNMLASCFSGGAGAAGVSAGGFARATGLAAAGAAMVMASKSMAASAGKIAVNTGKLAGKGIVEGSERVYHSTARAMGVKDAGDGLLHKAQDTGSTIKSMFGGMASFAGHNGLAASNAVDKFMASSGVKLSSGETKLAKEQARNYMDKHNMNAKEAAEAAVNDMNNRHGGSQSQTQENSVSGFERPHTVTSTVDQATPNGSFSPSQDNAKEDYPNLHNPYEGAVDKDPTSTKTNLDGWNGHD